MEYSNLFVCLMGMGTVFVGLICIVLIVSIMSAIVRKLKGNAAAPAPVAAAPVQPQVNSGKKPELIAAIAAAIAEDMGTDVSAIRIVSIKKV
jgi:sodium pump decarboxylase gamma subunit